MTKIFEKSVLQGGLGGNEWDDEVYEGIRKVYVGQDSCRVSYVKFEYVKKDGQVVTHEYGKIEQQPKEFVVEYPDEYIVAVEGSYSIVNLSATEVITSLVFKTSKGRSSPTFDQNLLEIMIGKKFVLGDGRKKILGFHGRSGNALDALGVYLETESLNKSSLLYKLEAQGGFRGRVWDDSSSDGIKKIRLSQDTGSITYLEFEYDNGGNSEIRHHGVKGPKLLEFVVNYPKEYIKSVEATYGRPTVFANPVITSLTFQTSTGKTSFFGYKGLKNFKLEHKGRRIVGFHGRESTAIDALGAYFAPLLPPAKKLQAVGGNGGVSWDDGAYDNVKTILVGQGNDGVSFVKFEYIKGAEIVYGDDHGKKSLLGAEKFELEEGEYLTGMEGYYDKVYGIEEPLIVCLKFKTNKKESIPYGIESGERFLVGEEGYKIVGFHGKAADVVHSVGVSVVPITTTTA